MGLFRAYFRDDVDELVERNVRMRIIGSRARADADILTMIEDGERRTAGNTGLQRHLCLRLRRPGGNRGRRPRHGAKRPPRGELDPAQITPEYFASRLHTSGLPDPDLVIRTSGERRLSNFLLVAVGLCRAAVPRHALAGLLERAVSGCAGEFCSAASAASAPSRQKRSLEPGADAIVRRQST